MNKRTLSLRSSALRSVFFGFAALLPSTLLPTLALADDDPEAKAAALSREAEKDMKAGRTADACNKYEQSHALDPRGETILAEGLCREKEGKIGTAYNLFLLAEKVSNEEGRSDRASTAKNKASSLSTKVAKLTVTPPKESIPGLIVTVGGQPIPNDQFGKPYAVDIGDLKVVATAPAKETWEGSTTTKPAGKHTLVIPEMKAGSGPVVPVKPEDPKPEDPKPEDPKPQDPKPEDPPTAVGHRPKGFVFDMQALAGLHVSVVGEAPQSLINDTQYRYNGPMQSQFLASCGDEDSVPGAGDCVATFKPQAALLAGAQVFVGYGFSEKIQLGARIFGGFHYPLGFEISGGPSLSIHVTGPLWLGVTALVGTSQTEAVVTGARGSFPDDLEVENGGESTVAIGNEGLAGGLAGGDKTAADFGRLEVGGAAEVSLVLIDSKKAPSGALMLSAWPYGMWSQGGAVIGVPIGFGYRFY